MSCECSYNHTAYTYKNIFLYIRMCLDAYPLCVFFPFYSQLVCVTASRIIYFAWFGRVLSLFVLWYIQEKEAKWYTSVDENRVGAVGLIESCDMFSLVR